MKFFFTILIFFSFNVSAQTLFWIGSGHNEYFVQQSNDSYLWNTIGTVPGTTDTAYQFNISPSSYYYRIYADADTSNCILVYNKVLSISTDSVFHPQRHFDNSIKIINQGNQLKVLVSSERDERVQYQLCDAVGRVLQSGEWFIKKGLNTTYLPFNYAHGVYIVLLQSAYEKVVRKVVK